MIKLFNKRIRIRDWMLLTLVVGLGLALSLEIRRAQQEYPHCSQMIGYHQSMLGINQSHRAMVVEDLSDLRRQRSEDAERDEFFEKRGIYFKEKDYVAEIYKYYEMMNQCDRNIQFYSNMIEIYKKGKGTLRGGLLGIRGLAEVRPLPP